jgi:hypothetical protein
MSTPQTPPTLPQWRCVLLTLSAGLLLSLAAIAVAVLIADKVEDAMWGH